MISDLLAIDVAAELRALSSEQLRASWQVPSELVRLAVRLGAERVAVERRRRGFSLRAEGAAMDGERVEDLAAAIDPGRPPDARHRALLRLEADGHQALLWAAGAGAESLAVESCGSARWTRLSGGARRTPALETAPAGSGEEWFQVALAARAFDGRRAMAWLEAATRFCPIPVLVDGTPTQHPFDAVVLSSSCRRPLPARLAVTLSGDAPRLWLLRHGVLACQATVPGWPPFVAAIELAGRVRRQASPDELRQAVEPHLRALAERVVEEILAAVKDLSQLPEAARERLVCVLLRAARAGLRREQILQAPLLRVVDGAGGKEQWRSPEELRELTGNQAQPVVVITADAGVPGGRGGGPLTVVLSTEQRSLLSELLGVGLERPAAEGGSGPGWWLSSRRAFAWLRPGRWWPAPPRIVPSDELLQPELGLLAVLNGQLAPPLEARLCAGEGAVRRRRNRLLLPRHNPLVVRALRLASADRAWLYPAALALLGDEAHPSPELRERWRRRCLSGDETPPAAEPETVG